MNNYLRYHCPLIILIILAVSIFLLTFYLYGIPLFVVIYPFLLSSSLILLYFFYDYHRYRRSFKQLQKLLAEPFALPLPPLDGYGIFAQEYQELLERFVKHLNEVLSNNKRAGKEMVDYYVAWVHQIKTPIASMKLLLESDDSVQGRQLKSELLRIEQYVSMVLVYLRLDSPDSDYIFKRFDLDKLLKEMIRRYRGDFIARHLELDYQLSQAVVLSDEKWLAFLLEQLLSNALKYTKEGRITISFADNKLTIADSGMGISATDLPRIFEKGFTGNNGHRDYRSSGLGLYLVKEIADRLNIELGITSVVGQGTCVSLVFPSDKGVTE